MRPLVTMVLPTIGRPTLERTLASLRCQAPATELEILVVGDTHDGGANGLVNIGPRLRDWGVRYLEHDGGYHAWGHPQRTYGQQQARGHWIMFAQDDNVYCAHAWAGICHALAAGPRQPHLFRIDTWQAGPVWRMPVLAYGNIDADCIAVPNEPLRLLPWGQTYAADYDYIAATCEAWGGVTWDDVLLARGRPEERWASGPPLAG